MFYINSNGREWCTPPHYRIAPDLMSMDAFMFFLFLPSLQVTKRDEDSSLMQLKEEFRTYEALRREHDSQIVQIAMEGGLRIAPDQWSSLLYGDQSHKSHMQSIIDKVARASISDTRFINNKDFCKRKNYKRSIFDWTQMSLWVSHFINWGKRSWSLTWRQKEFLFCHDSVILLRVLSSPGDVICHGLSCLYLNKNPGCHCVTKVKIFLI